MNDTDQRHRVVVLGAGGVGKSSVIKRFLFGAFTPEYHETVEDLFCRQYDISGSLIKVDILDTAGNIPFPAMRRLSISTAHAFTLVYSITNVDSYKEVKELWIQIKEERRDYEKIPVVIVGNKVDLENDRVVEKFDALDWVNNDGLKGRFVEVSAKTGECINDIFRILLIQANIPTVRQLEPFLKRRLSLDHTAEDGASDGAVDEEKKKFLRSRSLIRRGSKPKIKRSGHPGKNDCGIS